MPETVDMLCNKLGVVVDELIPQVANLNFCSSIVWLLAGLLMVLVFVIYVFVISTRIDKSDFLDAYDKSFVIGLCYVITGVIAAIGLLIVVCNICSIIEWSIAPKAKAIEYIVDWVTE